MPPTCLLLMGPCGCGKTTLAAALAAELQWPFQEGDALHPASNVAKMASGQPLSDADRQPWLACLGAWAQSHMSAGRSCIVTCSALKLQYRELLRSALAPAERSSLFLLLLQGSREQLAQRLAARVGHFMRPELLDSQLAILELPRPEEGPCLAVPLELPLEQAVQLALAALPQQ
jgi:gluconokinase